MTWKLSGKLISLTLLFVSKNLIIAFPIGIVIMVLLNNYIIIFAFAYLFLKLRLQKPYSNYFQHTFYELLLLITF